MTLITHSLQANADGLHVGLALDPLAGDTISKEWAWALRGGGADLRTFSTEALESPIHDLELLVFDSVPISQKMRKNLEAWVRDGGLLIYAGAKSAKEGISPQGGFFTSPNFIANELLGAQVSGSAPGLKGSYPYIDDDNAMISPLKKGDGLRLGVSGVDHEIQLEATTARVLATSAYLAPNSEDQITKEKTPTILLNRFSKGWVIFLTFSPGQIGACYPDYRESSLAKDCSGASNAHALMRWVVANLLWEAKGKQIPLLSENPGAHPHALVITGDVHDRADTLAELEMASVMADQLVRQQIPFSYYIVGSSAQHAPEIIKKLRGIDTLELSGHTSGFKMFNISSWYPSLGALGVLSDLRKTNLLLGVPHYPDQRNWLVSYRSHGWQSLASSWHAMTLEGVGLVFDNVADRLPRGTTYQLPASWFKGHEERRLFVPIFEKSVVTGGDGETAASFILSDEDQTKIASLASAQAEPCCSNLPYAVYSGYVQRWNQIWARMATMGGLTEVWLWHPGGVGGRKAYEELNRTIQDMKANPAIAFYRGDVIANWRANRERFQTVFKRDKTSAIVTAESKHTLPLVGTPPGQTSQDLNINYWVIGNLSIAGWDSHSWRDPYARTVTQISHPLKALDQH